jgi:hypothetical protein
MTNGTMTQWNKYSWDAESLNIPFITIDSHGGTVKKDFSGSLYTRLNLADYLVDFDTIEKGSPREASLRRVCMTTLEVGQEILPKFDGPIIEQERDIQVDLEHKMYELINSDKLSCIPAELAGSQTGKLMYVMACVITNDTLRNYLGEIFDDGDHLKFISEIIKHPHAVDYTEGLLAGPFWACTQQLFPETYRKACENDSTLNTPASIDHWKVLRQNIPSDLFKMPDGWDWTTWWRSHLSR